MAYLAVSLLGVAAWRNIPIELLPDTQLPRLTVSASWPGASPETTEAFLTAPLEAAVQQVRGVERLVSVSEDRFGAGSATLTVEFSRETDMDFARLELSERLRALDELLPADVTRPQVTPYVPREFREQTRPFLAYTVSGPFTTEALRDHLDRIVVPELVQVDGVAAVEAEGGRARLVEIEVDAIRAAALGLSAERIRQAIGQLDIVRQAGTVDIGGGLHALAIRHQLGSAAALRDQWLLAAPGAAVRVGDVATVRETREEPRDFYRIDGQPAVSFTVYREIGSNAVAVADRVKARLAALEHTHPAGVRLILDNDEGDAIRAQLSDLRLRALGAAAVIFLVLLLFLRSARSAAIVFATIAFSILITLNGIYWGGLSLNVLTLMGLAMGFGLIVDNAIVVLENVYRHRRGRVPAPDAAERGAREVVLPVIASTLTTLVVVVPFVYLQGELRAFYLPLAVVVVISLLASVLVAFSFIPALAARLLVPLSVSDAHPDASGGESHHGSARGAEGGIGDPAPAAGPPAPAKPEGRPERGAARFQSALTATTLRFPWSTVLLAALLLGGAYHLFDTHVNRGVVWRAWWQDQNYISIQISLPRGGELGRTDELVRHFEARLGEIREVERFVTRVQPRWATIRVTFPPEVEESAAPLLIKDRLTAYSHQFGGAQVRVYGYGPSFYGGGGAPPNYALRVHGYNYEAVREIAEDLGRRLTNFARIQEVDTNATGQWYEQDRATELVLELDRARLSAHGLSARETVDQVRAAIAGAEGRASVLRIGGEATSFAVKLAGHDRLDDLALREVLIPTANGAGVRLGDVATLGSREVQQRILRENQQYQRIVAYEFRGPARLGDRVRDAVVEATALPPGYALLRHDAWRWSDEERQQVYAVLLLALALVFMTTAALFESLRQPFCVLLTVPLALIGVFVTFYLAGASFSREAYIGVIMMAGIVVNNAILLVDHANRLRREHGVALREAIAQATRDRSRPILMTSATTIFGLLPLVLFSVSADENIWNALAYALIGGLSSSTVLVLTVTPALYLLLERGPERRRSRAVRARI